MATMARRRKEEKRKRPKKQKIQGNVDLPFLILTVLLVIIGVAGVVCLVRAFL